MDVKKKIVIIFEHFIWFELRIHEILYIYTIYNKDTIYIGTK